MPPLSAEFTNGHPKKEDPRFPAIAGLTEGEGKEKERKNVTTVLPFLGDLQQTVSYSNPAGRGKKERRGGLPASWRRGKRERKPIYAAALNGDLSRWGATLGS